MLDHMNAMQHRIKTARRAAGLTQTELAEACGVKRESVSQWENGHTVPESERLRSIAESTGFSVEWLMTGRGSMRPGAAVQVWESPEDVQDPAAYVPVSLFDVRLSAGDGAEWVAHPDSETLLFRAAWIRKRGLKPEACRALTVRGASMEPTLMDGDTVLIDTSRTAPVDDAVFALLYHGDMFIKRLFRLPGESGVELVSDNPRYPVRRVTGADLDHLVILGRQVWRAG